MEVVKQVILQDAAVMPVTIPVDTPTVATDALLLVQVTPDIDEVKEVVEPEHSEREPEITGTGFTVTVAVT